MTYTVLRCLGSPTDSKLPVSFRRVVEVRIVRPLYPGPGTPSFAVSTSRGSLVCLGPEAVYRFPRPVPLEVVSFNGQSYVLVGVES